MKGSARGGLCAGIDKLCFSCYNKTYIKKRPIELHRRSIMENVGNLQSYRKGVKLLDATLRDGGIVNSFYFKDDFVKALYEANLAAGVDIMEFGYKVSKKMFDTSKFGKWKFCEEKDIRAIVGEN